MKDTLRLKILWTWIKIRPNFFIKTLLNIWNENQQRYFENYHPRKKCDFPLQRTLNQNRWYFTYCYMLLFLSNKASFKSNSVFIDIMNSFCQSLFTFLPFDFCLYYTHFQVHPMPLRVFQKKKTVTFWWSSMFVL